MSLKKSDGNMYDWVTHMHTHLRGKCPHACQYCYVQSIAKDLAEKRHLPKMLEMYSGPVRLEEKEFLTQYGQGRVIFMEHMNDLFSLGVPTDWQDRIIRHANNWPMNDFVYQTKSPATAIPFIGRNMIRPDRDYFGTTIETNRNVNPCAPWPSDRAVAMAVIRMKHPNMRLFVTVEPVLDFDVDAMLNFMVHIKPTFINIGADSKGNGLVEPSADKLRAFIAGVQALGIEIREKKNLGRILK